MRNIIYVQNKYKTTAVVFFFSAFRFMGIFHIEHETVRKINADPNGDPVTWRELRFNEFAKQDRSQRPDPVSLLQ